VFKRTKKKLEEKIKQKTRLEEIKTNVVKLVFSLFRFIVLLFQLFYFSKSTSKETRNNTNVSF
jgi:capsule polysaccharide export protein KpsE/RkpR